MSFTVAIVGRPNVGKSTLFNRIVGKRLALVDDTPGVTRDRREGDGRIGALRFSVFDTAGLEVASKKTLEGRMQSQTEMAIEQSDVVVFVIDAVAGVTPLDSRFAELLRKSDTPIILVANKCESRKGKSGLNEAFSLGLGEAIALSAEHGEGMVDLGEAIRNTGVIDDQDIAVDAEIDALDHDEEGGKNRPLRIAVIGRPNAGKSTFINSLIGEDRLLTGPEAGVTRDSIGVEWTYNNKPLKLFDTAGMRRRGRVSGKLEKLSVADGLRAVKFAEVVVLMIDADQPLEKQDIHIADLVEREGRALVIAVNKWDTVKDKARRLKELRAEAQRILPQFGGIPLVAISALKGHGFKQLMTAVFEVYALWNQRVNTAKLNDWFREAIERHPPPAIQGRRIKLKFITQAKIRPPTFAAFCSLPDDLPKSYVRYLIKSMREVFNMPGIPIRLHLRKGKNPYAGKKR
jgi:GTP-binding protein